MLPSAMRARSKAGTEKRRLRQKRIAAKDDCVGSVACVRRRSLLKIDSTFVLRRRRWPVQKARDGAPSRLPGGSLHLGNVGTV
jgi:hypothetical protein